MVLGLFCFTNVDFVLQIHADSGLGQIGTIYCPKLDLNAQGYAESLFHERVEYAWMIDMAVSPVAGSLGIQHVSYSLYFKIII